MKTYIISYDLSQPGQNYETLLQKIKSYPQWARLGGSAYIILSEATHIEIRDFLQETLDTNDKLFVSIVTAPAAWYGLGNDVSNWLIDKLK